MFTRLQFLTSAQQSYPFFFKNLTGEASKEILELTFLELLPQRPMGYAYEIDLS